MKQAQAHSPKASVSIEDFISQFNEASMQAELTKLGDLMHPEVVFVLPDLQTSIDGIDACLQSVQEYANTAQTHKYEVRNQQIQQVGPAATILLTYFVEYEMNAQTYRELGSEVWNLVRMEDNWKMIWRGLIRSESVE